MRAAKNQDAILGQRLALQRISGNVDYFVVTKVLDKIDDYGNIKVMVKLEDGLVSYKYDQAYSARPAKRSQSIARFDIA